MMETDNRARLAVHFESDGGDLDVVGIGALNLDYIADGTSSVRSDLAASQVLHRQFGSPIPLEQGTETSVDDKTVYAVLEAVNSASLSASLGGSAFNAIYALAQMRLHLRLGYFGVSGKIPMPGLSSIQQLKAYDVDISGIANTQDAFCGVCFSFLEQGERTLLTHSGANELMGLYIETHFDAALSYLSRARIVHLTSFLDSETPPQLVRLMKALKHLKPSVIISFDPGHVWAEERSPETLELAALSDFLLLNNREFRALADAAEDEPDENVAVSLLGNNSSELAIMVKRPHGIASFCMDQGRLDSRFYPQLPLREDEIQDATGAGDVFAAGLLAVLGNSSLQLEFGALLGMELARHKLRYVGSHGHADFAELTKNFISLRDAKRRRESRPHGVFIAHGGDSQWFAVKDFVEAEFTSPVHSFESGVWGSTQISGVLDEYLRKCGIAICVLTVEDLILEGRGFARQNVIHEVGLFQGRYGPERVLVMVEDGCEFYPDVSSTPPLTFTRNRMREAFWSLREQLLSKGVEARGGPSRPGASVSEVF